MTQEFVTLPRAVVEQAIDALYCTDSEEGSPAYNFELKAVKELRAALEQPQECHDQRDPLADQQIDAIAESMPGGLDGFLKGWGWRQFARAVLEAAPQPPALEQQVEKESTCKDYLQVEQEPVAWLKTWNSVGHARTGMQRLDLTPECETWLANMFPTITPLYTHPQPKREPLTHYEIHELFRRSWDDCQDGDEIKAFARAIEAAHGIK